MSTETWHYELEDAESQRYAIYDAEDGFLVEVYGEERARLIAAAPELLDALEVDEDVEEFQKAAMMELDKLDYPGIIAHVAAYAQGKRRAAIAKARGRK